MGQDRAHARDRQRARDVDRPDVRARVRAAQGRAPQHPIHPHVRGVLELALDLRDAVRPDRRRPDDAGPLDFSGAPLPRRRGGNGRHIRASAFAASRRLARAISAATCDSSAVRSSPPSTIGRPPTSSSSTACVAPNTSAATGSSIPAPSSPSSRQSATSASLPTSSEPSSSSRPRQRAPSIVARASAWRAVSRLRAAGQTGELQRGAHLGREPAVLVRGGAVDAEADGDARAYEARRPVRSPRRAAHSSSGSGRPPCRWRRSGAISASLRCTQCASHTSSPSQPSSSR